MGKVEKFMKTKDEIAVRDTKFYWESKLLSKAQNRDGWRKPEKNFLSLNDE